MADCSSQDSSEALSDMAMTEAGAASSANEVPYVKEDNENKLVDKEHSTKNGECNSNSKNITDVNKEYSDTKILSTLSKDLDGTCSNSSDSFTSKVSRFVSQILKTKEKTDFDRIEHKLPTESKAKSGDKMRVKKIHNSQEIEKDKRKNENSEEKDNVIEEAAKAITEYKQGKGLNEKKSNDLRSNKCNEQTKNYSETNKNTENFSKEKPMNELGEPMFHKDPDIKTLDDALKVFKLKSDLNILENSLECLRRKKITIETHESHLKEFDKKLQRLSLKYHPDKVKINGGSEEDVAIAQKLQSALNATRKILNVLHKEFLEDLSVDHRYGYYTKLSISLLGNEDEVKNHVFEVIFKISFISQIIEQNIIAEIRNFLAEANGCIKSFFDNKTKEFEKCHSSALFHLKKCITGYKKLLMEVKIVEEECKNENLENINYLLEKLSSGYSRNLNTLKDIKDVAKESLSGGCYFFSIPEYIDEYFIAPFAVYINVINMCSVMLKETKKRLWNIEFQQTDPTYNNTSDSIIYLYYLASVFFGEKKYKNIVEHRLGCNSSSNRDIIKTAFCTYLEQIKQHLEIEFNVNNYYSDSKHVNCFVKEYEKCMQVLADFKMKEKEFKNDIEKLACKSQEMEDKYAKAMKECQELNSKIEERIAQCKLLREKNSASLENR